MEIEGDGGPAVPLTPGPPKVRTVLGTLLVQANQVVTVDTLVAELWRDAPPRTVSTTLQVYISQLRKLLDTADPGHGRDLLLTHARGYRLAVEDDGLDLTALEDLHRRGREALAAGDHRDAADLYRRAAALRRGPLLSDTPHGPLLESVATQLAEAESSALAHRIHADLQLGRHHELIGELRTLTARYPLREELHEHLLLALYRAGRQAEALQAFAALRTHLVAELGVEPGPSVRRLHGRILTGDPELLRTPEPAAGGPTTTRGPAAEPPDVRAGTALPAADPAFTGRGPALALVEEFLRNAPAGAFVAIAGQPGVGKTALALEAAHRSGPAFPDGRLFLDLQPEPGRPLSAVEAVTALLRRLGVRPAADAGAGELLDTWQQELTGRRLLLVLDNVDSEAQLRPLLPGTPGSAAIVTGRRLPVGLGGIRPVVLDVPDPAESRRLFTAVAGHGREAAEPEAVTELLELCGRLPLAVRIAGAQLTARPHWSAATLVERLREERTRLGELRIGGLDARAALVRAYRDAGPVPRWAFRLLGLLPAGPFGPAAADAVLGLPRSETTRLLDELVDDRLLVAGPEQGRYRLPELLRVLAVERLADEEGPAEAAAAVERLCTEYARVATQVTAVLTHGLSADGARWDTAQLRPSDWFTRERDALVRAVRQAHGYGRWAAVVRLAGALRGHLEAHADWGAWARTHALALDAARRCGDRAAEGRMLRSLGDLAWEQRRPAQAEEHYELARRITEETGDRAELALTLVGLAELRCDRGEFGAAAELLAAAPDVAEPRPRFEVRRALALLALAGEDHLGALAHFTACRDLALALHDRRLESFARRAIHALHGDRPAAARPVEFRPGVWRLPRPAPYVLR
ncbi:AfsR/SARP family transcriptional regulator [Kitasatospora sp. NPDC096204]|uniref:AfsR/SARP family transcriptional regulator n=1 Tax=Kitasatospora sp. NPDC096204 TaxID=3364094 RepID=UPI00382F9771